MQKLRALAVALLAGLTLFYAVGWLHDLVFGWWVSSLKDTLAVFAAGAGTNAVFSLWHAAALRPREEVNTVEKMTMVSPGPGKPPEPGWLHEDYEEYADHSLDHDDLPR